MSRGNSMTIDLPTPSETKRAVWSPLTTSVPTGPTGATLAGRWSPATVGPPVLIASVAASAANEVVRIKNVLAMARPPVGVLGAGSATADMAQAPGAAEEAPV